WPGSTPRLEETTTCRAFAARSGTRRSPATCRRVRTRPASPSGALPPAPRTSAARVGASSPASRRRAGRGATRRSGRQD
ncbi:MAG: hypothetical protein AVDCRST_MAG49-3480, partial [uncultured Thermomicrobiales bacterium]